MSQRSMEVKVGVLILVALALLGGFVVIMGGLTFQRTFTVAVDFDNPGGLKAGAPVRLSGIKIGRVGSIDLLTGKNAGKAVDRTALIRVVAGLESQFKDAIHEDSRWFVTTQGVLGEPYLAVEPGTPDSPLLKDGAVVRGVSPPRLDLLMSEAYELLHRAYVGITENDKKIGETFDALHRTLKGSGDFFERNSGKLDHMVDEADAMTRDAHATLLSARDRYVDGPQVTRMMNDLEKVSRSLASDLPPLLSDGKKSAAHASEMLEVLAAREQLERYRAIIKNAEGASAEAQAAAREAQALITRISQGKGTVGALLRDEAVYDDLQELLRDLKHNPWKLFWRQ